MSVARRREVPKQRAGVGLFGPCARAALVISVLCVCVLVSVFVSSAAADAPAWNITASATPTNFPPNSNGEPRGVRNRELGGNEIVVIARNLGDTPISGSVSPITVAVNLQGVTGDEIAGEIVGIANKVVGPASCVQPAGPCTYSGTLEPSDSLIVRVEVRTRAAGTAQDTATVSGGQATGVAPAAASVVQRLTVSSSPASFGLQPSSVLAEFTNADDGPETQAGAHPYELAVDFALNDYIGHPNLTETVPSEEMKDIAVELPSGVAGNELALTQCTSLVLSEGKCTGASQVGAVQVTLAGGVGTWPWAMFNVKPDNGHTNELGFNANGGFPIHMPTVVRTGGDYGLTNITRGVPNSAGAVDTVESEVWGVPQDPAHTPQRVLSGWLAAEDGPENGGFPSPLPATPFLTMPSQCGVPLVFRVAVDSYGHPGKFEPDGSPDLNDPNWKVVSVTDPPLEGCERLQSFSPHLTVAPDTTYADTPSGTTVEVSVPQGEGLTNPNVLATPTLQNTTVTLPEGMAINPGQANGLGACQYSEDGVGTTGPPSCPANSKVGTVQIETPLLPDKLEGDVYVLQSNPPDLQLLVAASADDVNLKLIGDVHLNESTGQLTSTFDGTPALPFTHFRLTFSGGGQAALMTPPSCGVYSSISDFTPWSSPFTPDFLAADAFQISSGPGGSECASPLPFHPAMIAGSTTDQAGGYTDFSLLLTRGDGEQRIGALQFKTPEGLLGMVSSVPLCEEPQAAQGTCPASSQIGHTVVGAGAGPDQFYVPQAGQPPAPIYLTGPYRGAPFGLSIVVPVVAGPFNLGTVVVRAAINVDPATSQLTISTEALPQILDGIPTDLRQIDAVIDRPGFMFNPTNCAAMAFSGTAESAEGATAPISSHFQVGSCQALKFKPNFKAATSGRPSRLDGTSLDVRIVYPTGPLGANQASSQSNIAKVKVSLPKQLPSRLPTLQKACTAAVFEANPAACPTASRVGYAQAVTPVLAHPLSGPAFFVSHGGEEFPSLIVVLQGEGVRVDLVGTTFISNSGITSSTFANVPDVPIYSFQLYLPQGPYSALTALGNVCREELKMPTVFTAQNGAVIEQQTPIAVTGCASTKAKVAKKSTKKTKKTAAKARKARQALVGGKPRTPTANAYRGHAATSRVARMALAGTPAAAAATPATARAATTAVAVAPVVGAQGVNYINENSALIEGEINPEGQQASYQVQYGTSTNYGSNAPATPAALAPYTSSHGIIVAIAGLTPGTTYHYRILATSPAGETDGPDATFTTNGAAPPGSFTSFQIPAVPQIPAAIGAFPTEEPASTRRTTTKTVTGRQKLANALKACKKNKTKSKRATCEKRARKRYRGKKDK